jgi:hypothetical protein
MKRESFAIRGAHVKSTFSAVPPGSFQAVSCRIMVRKRRVEEPAVFWQPQSGAGKPSTWKGRANWPRLARRE